MSEDAAPTANAMEQMQEVAKSIGQLGVPLLVLDVDGTVRKGFDELGKFVNGPEDVEVFPEVHERMTQWKRHGGRILFASNQGGIATGLVSIQSVVEAMKVTIAELMLGDQPLVDKVGFCMHHPESPFPELRQCWCRKPNPGLIIESGLELGAAFGEFYPPHLGLVVGDRPEDEGAAMNAGFPFLSAAEWRAGSQVWVDKLAQIEVQAKTRRIEQAKRQAAMEAQQRRQQLLVPNKKLVMP